jgi:hypothetical protein
MVKGVVLGAGNGHVVVRLYTYNRFARHWMLTATVRVTVGRHGGFSLAVAGHSRPRRMRVQVRFPGTATAAPSVSRYANFTA